MSVSSASSEYGDDGNVVSNDYEDVDYYAVLNVPRDATIEEINKAYRHRCRIFHPDRHMDDGDKRDAEKFFVRLRKAHETLVDPKLRAIYDTVGAQGLELQGWELIARSGNAEDVRREYEFLKRLRDTELMLQRVHPSGTFAFKTSFTGLFAADPYDRSGPQLTGMTLTQNVEGSLSATNKLGASGRVKMANGRGEGALILNWKSALPFVSVFENSLTMSPESVTLTSRLGRNVFERSAVIVQPSLQYFPLMSVFRPGCAFIYTMRLSARLQGTIVLHVGIQQAITTSVVYMEMNLPKFIFNFTLSPTGSNIRTVYTWRKVEHDAFYEASCLMGFFGITPAISFERRLSRYSRIGCSISLSLPTCLLNAKFKVRVSSYTYEYHVALCDNDEDIARAMLFGVVLPCTAFHLAKAIFRGTYNRIMNYFEDHSEERQVNNVKREEASHIMNLMRPTANRIAREEEAKGGLVIVEARYGQMVGEGRSAEMYPLLGDRSIDVTVALQAMVNDSQLRIYSAKSQLPGFYDPCPMEAKILRVVYRYKGHMHSVSVREEMALHIPMMSHRLGE